MIRLLFTLATLILVLNAQTTIDTKIKLTSKKLNKFSQNYKWINQKMAQTAEAILKQKKELLKQEAYLQKLQAKLQKKEGSYDSSKEELQQLQVSKKNLKREKDKIEQDLVFVVAQSVSLSVILEEKDTTNTESLIEFEVLKEMLKRARAKAKKLNKQFYEYSKDIHVLVVESKFIKASILDIDSKRKKVLATREQNKKALAKLKKAKKSYKKRVKTLLSKQDTLKKTLAKLNIIKIDAIRKAKEEKERKKAFEANMALDGKLPKVKQHGSSYQSIQTKRYRGAKTIPPFDKYTIIKKYGTYTDPIYGIKIFNESISLKPNAPRTKVKNVFNGKVIYADKTALLNNIVIIENRNGIHTIFANLSEIAPNIKRGKKIKKGYTIGRVDDELVFEVTQKSYHINPVELFQ